MIFCCPLDLSSLSSSSLSISLFLFKARHTSTLEDLLYITYPPLFVPLLRHNQLDATTYFRMGRHIRALLVPSDGTPMHLICIKTIEVSPTDPNPSLGHHPDLRKYWGLAGWERRIATSLTISGESNPKLNGKYWLFRSLADAHLGINKHVGEHCFGDAFVVKVVGDGGDKNGNAGFMDVSRDVLGNEVAEKAVERMKEPTEM